ncbi:DUF4166 domain-containing protein [Streptomonospora sp. S1-112]|uniref:DUF4166 domain-containing protein n=1 Tax=Streptomonospora mangrovi TaxID=2883123 RepID=A0A9X3SE64_9ACTN|nr:DUF4166 domain-containing protein [Streptomonospora mangrovi]MDA0563415.1 DUF4166 domain-containing protein [Streptomonospora mangrovi]
MSAPGAAPAGAEEPLFRRALGADFDRLHPRLRRRFSTGLATGEACLGRGTMDRIWRGGAWVQPFLLVGALRNILVPRTGRGVAFTIENTPYRDSFGRQAVSFVRTFALPGGARRFDAAMVYSPERGCVVDYLGTHHHLAVDLHPGVDAHGALVIRSGAQRLREGPLDVGLPGLLSGAALVRESYDEAAGCFRVSVRVSHPVLGAVFGYEGSFTVRYVALERHRPGPGVRPRREERRV